MVCGFNCGSNPTSGCHLCQQQPAGHHPVIPAVDHTPQFSAARCHHASLPQRYPRSYKLPSTPLPYPKSIRLAAHPINNLSNCLYIVLDMADEGIPVQEKAAPVATGSAAAAVPGGLVVSGNEVDEKTYRDTITSLSRAFTRRHGSQSWQSA
ncbi:hypothetical protein O988_02607 [Pseudogymnoascus sp. VKM F-3808]|nr:hypothetical protein O988_02607 [Pseudogymnoascus sp. VKM F-3808]